MHCPSVGTGRQAWLRAMCPYGRAGSSPALGTFSLLISLNSGTRSLSRLSDIVTSTKQSVRIGN